MVSSESTKEPIGWDETAAKTKELDQQREELRKGGKDKKQFDANDYSRFANVWDEDDDKDKEGARSGEKKTELKDKENAAVQCRNCFQDGATMKCSVCKKASYCSRNCQRDDWKFHKRICKKEEEKAKKPPAKSPPSAAASSTLKKSSNPPASKTSVGSSKPRRSEKIEVNDEHELKDARGYKNGLPYFHREQTEEEKNLIGDIQPKKIDPTSHPIAAPKTETHASAWNSAGTFEERDFSQWAKQQLKKQLHPISVSVEDVGASIETTGVSTVDGDASVLVVRGKKRYIYDFNVEVKWKIVHGDKEYKGKFNFHDVSNDGDHELSTRWEKKPSGQLFTTLNNHIARKSGSFTQQIMKAFDSFVAEFQKL